MIGKGEEEWQSFAQELLPHLLVLDDSSLRAYASKGEKGISLDFLLWLKNRCALGIACSMVLYHNGMLDGYAA